MQRLLLIGLNHTTAPLEVREKLAFAPQQTLFALAELQKRLDHCEAVILSTCNRVELYLAGPAHIDRNRVVQFLADFHDLPEHIFAPHLYELRGRVVIEHLLSVASSLDSMVLGETQILGQVRQAYETSRSANATGSLLNPLFQRAVSVGREVLTHTQLAEGRVSVASVAADYARRIFDRFDDKTVLCVGTGKMTQLVLQNFISLSAGKLVVCSRVQERADEIARKFGGRGVAFSEIEQQLVASDIVITSTGAPHPIITRKRFEGLLKQRRYRPIFIIDIAVPRDVEASVGDLENVYLYNLDDLQEVVGKTLSLRSEAVEQAQVIVSRHVDAFLQWHRQREIGPLIDALYKRYNEIARAELERATARMELDSAQRQQLEEAVHRMVQKMLHDPVSRLRESPEPHGVNTAYVHAIEQLFKLDPQPTERAPDEQT
ncbi:MAG: glutamyl-tRNA reductase [Burkholderiales bacterium]|nr:glutamyl-tRNA reductase [Phycisphaerae bacterium]